MVTTVATVLGVQADRVQAKTYVAFDKNKHSEVLKDTAAGRMIFDYDPRGGPDSKRRTPQAAWRILWQNEQIDADAWIR